MREREVVLRSEFEEDKALRVLEEVRMGRVEGLDDGYVKRGSRVLWRVLSVLSGGDI